MLRLASALLRMVWRLLRQAFRLMVFGYWHEHTWITTFTEFLYFPGYTAPHGEVHHQFCTHCDKKRKKKHYY